VSFVAPYSRAEALHLAGPILVAVNHRLELCHEPMALQVGFDFRPVLNIAGTVVDE
jgi:hypothetical protein